ncbi:hypothetical protein F8S13_06545 [Chloroflexia bacterium SDU3-3]|nr:hypothetical protein F8S13_06545 [Chloroflexia bacterium SDU3-3]
MLHRVLEELQQSSAPISLDALSARLGIERTALEGMIAYWVRKGRLSDSAVAGCSTSNCGSCAVGPKGCSFAQSSPRVITLVDQRRH